MKKLLILALASAIAAASNAAAESWFSANSSGPTGAEWSSTPVVDVENNVISVDTDVGSKLTLSPTATKPSPEVKTVVEVQAAFTAASDYASLDSPGDDAKTALTVAKDGDTLKYYYWDSAESDPNVNKWKPITGLTPTLSETPVTVKFELDNSSTAATTARITIGDESGKAVTVDLAADTTLSALAFAGTGSLTRVAATVTPAYAKYNNKRYESTADAVTAKGNGTGDITLYAHNNAYDLPTDPNKLYFPINVTDNGARLYSFNKATEDNVDYYQIATAADLKALVDLTAYDNTALALNFKQTDDITLDTAWPGIGIQNGKDLATGNATEKGKFDAGAFKGIYDGGNKTISGFQMVGVAGNPASTTQGLDYCGFFNSTSGATIKNLKIQYAGALFAADTTSSTLESGATFVGVAKNSTLQNLTSLQKDANTAVSCSKGFGGIVGYTADGTVVDSCTNNVNMTSLAGNKCGGIAMITQNGNAVTIRNCQNNGTTAGNASQKGGIVGYVGVATEIADCEDTAGSDPSFLHHETGTLTMTGVNKAPAGVKSYTKNKTNISGLNFATVSGNVATFVADDALKAGNTYKVMGPTATATYAFTAPGSISFDTSLATPTTYAIASSTLKVTCAPDGENKVTYTAAVPEFTIEVPDNTLVTVGNEEFTTDAQLSMPYGTEVTITYTPAEGFVGEPKTQTITVASDTETISAPSTYVAPVPAVAKIGSTYYTTLAAAIGDAVNNDTVTLLDNVTLAEALNLELGNKAVTLDLGAKTLTGRTNLKSGSLTIKNGTVAGGSQQALNVYGSADTAATNYSVLTIASDVNVTADVYGVCMFGATAGSNGYGVVVNIAGRVTTTGTGKEGAVFVSGNLGQNVTGDAHNVINVTGKITSATDAAIALNGLATVNVSAGAEVTGNTAIAVKRGTLNIQGGTVHATGAKNYPGTPNYNGTEMTGAAISVSDTYSQYGAMGANVTGGTIMSDKADAIYKKAGDYKNDAPIAVSGGTFSSSVPVEFCADGFIPAQSGSTYGVEEGWKITWVVDGVKTVATVKKGANLTQPADPTKSGYEFKGWAPAVVETPAADATYTAQWKQTAIPVEVATAKTLVSVPQNCKASELIDTSNREKDDMLQVLNKTTQKYYQWSYDGEGGWTPNNVATVGDNVAETPEANTIDLVRGEAVWVTRKDASKEILLKAAYTDDPVTVSVIKGYNLVAPLPKAGVDTIAIDEVVADDSTSKDRVFIPAEGKAPYNLDFKDGKWGYDKYTVEGGKLKKARVTNVTIPAGTGFFYINNGDDTKNVTLGTGN